MTNEEMCLDALNLCKRTRIFIPSNELLDTAISALEENAKLKAEIEQLKQRLEVKDYNFELYSDALDEIERLKAELEQSVNKIKKKILSRRWVCTNDANPIEVLGMDWANKMNDWCIEIVEEAERSLKGKVEE